MHFDSPLALGLLPPPPPPPLEEEALKSTPPPPPPPPLLLLLKEEEGGDDDDDDDASLIDANRFAISVDLDAANCACVTNSNVTKAPFALL